VARHELPKSEPGLGLGLELELMDLQANGAAARVRSGSSTGSATGGGGSVDRVASVPFSEWNDYDETELTGSVSSSFDGTGHELFMHERHPTHPAELVKEETGCVLYATNVLGTKGPRQLTVCVPEPRADGQPAVLRPGLLERMRLREQHRGEGEEEEDVVRCNNMAPQWNQALGAYCLNFYGRVTLPSVKNMQLQCTDAPGAVVMQFGRVGPDEFTLDYSWPFNLLHATQIAMTVCDSKLAVE
jgi:tubby-related protein 1